MDESKKHILQTALPLFLQKSYKEVTLNEIALLSGVSVGGVYHHFKNKEAIFYATVQYGFFDSVTDTYAKYSRNSLQQFIADALAGIEARHKKIGKQTGKNQQFSFLTLVLEAVRSFPELKSSLQTFHANILAMWEEVIAAAKQTNEIQSGIPDSTLAELFVFVNNGSSTLSVMISENFAENMREMRQLWQSLYELLKT